MLGEFFLYLPAIPSLCSWGEYGICSYFLDGEEGALSALGDGVLALQGFPF